MRAALLVTALMLLPALGFAGETSSGGGTVIPDPGFCWGEGVVPGVPPDLTVVWPLSWSGDGQGGPSVYGPGSGGEGLSRGVGGGPTSAASKPAGLASREVRSQMYIPPAVWRWLAEHPVRAR